MEAIRTGRAGVVVETSGLGATDEIAGVMGLRTGRAQSRPDCMRPKQLEFKKIEESAIGVWLEPFSK